jgi:transposase
MATLKDEILKILSSCGNLTEEEAEVRAREILECVTQNFFHFDMPPDLRLVGVAPIAGGKGLVFSWVSVATESVCPKCGHVSHTPDSEHLRAEKIQDCCGYDGCQIWHEIWRKQFVCTNDPCIQLQFLETFEGFVCKRYGRMTIRLVNQLIELARGESLEKAVSAARALGIKISRKPLSSITKRCAARILKDNLVTNVGDVVHLGIDDINRRKGDSGSACTVFVNLDTHKILAIAEGTTAEAAYRVMKLYPNVTLVSRDRGTAMASAAKKIGAIQVADGFHVAQNLNVALKNVLLTQFPIGINVPIGDVWVKNSNIGKQEVPSTLMEADIANRVRFAQLNPKQEINYRNALTVLELTNSGKHAVEIAATLNLPVDQVRKIRDKLANIINEVEDKMDEFIKSPLTRVKTYESVGNSPRPSNMSIVAPFAPQVISLHKQGVTFRKIHESICQEGFTGCASTVDNFLIKYKQENSINKELLDAHVKNRSQSALKPVRPERIHVQSISANAIYDKVIFEIKKSRPEEVTAKSNKKAKSTTNLKVPLPELSWELNTALFGKTLVELVDPEFKEAKEAQKKAALRSREAYEKAKLTNPAIGRAIQFGVDFYQFYDSHNESLLDAFIVKYKNDPCWFYSNFARGLNKDLEAMKNMLRYPEISNGVVEGLNNYIKTIKRMSQGRANLPMLLAKVLI